MSLYTKIAFHQTKYNLKRVHPDCSCDLRYGASGFKQCDISVLYPLISNLCEGGLKCANQGKVDVKTLFIASPESDV